MNLDEKLAAYLDGELDAHDAVAAERILKEDPEARAFVAAQERLAVALRTRFDPILAEPVPERFRAMLDEKVVPFRRPAQRPQWRLQHWTALAASFAVGIVAAQLALSPAPKDSRLADLATGRVAEMLDTQLASVQDERASERVGVTFVADDGRICRTFEAHTQAGLACRTDGGWQIVASARTEAERGEYRQAGSGSAFVMSFAQEMMAGHPFDAEEEQLARERGWRPAR